MALFNTSDFTNNDEMDEILNFIYDKNDSIEVKIEKLQNALDYIDNNSIEKDEAYLEKLNLNYAIIEYALNIYLMMNSIF